MRITKDFKEFVGQKGILKIIATLFFNPCFHSVCLYRLSSFLYRLHLHPFAKIVWYLNRIIFNVDIDYRADLAGGFVLIHGLGTVIGMGVISKGRLTVYQGVTIGGNNDMIRTLEDGKVIEQPLFEDNVTVFTGAMVFGPIIIGTNNIIKAGKIVTSDMVKR